MLAQVETDSVYRNMTEDEKVAYNERVIDSLNSLKQMPNHIDQKERKRKKRTQYKSLTGPTQASFYTIVIPGLGQIHNNKAWKIPILYGGYAVFGYFIKFNHTNYIESSHWLAYKADADPTNDDLIPEIYRNLSVDNLVSRRDRFRRDRDFMIIVSCGWYLLGALDAAVDQHLKYYDVSEDLSFQFKPAAIPDPLTGLPALGATLTLNINSK
ncbi:DUF5683 domain-containing protein [Flammeovirga yaeyamensis]|uniref:DUF5683 domain-containing protein n=1 Tax=Flammeovirga yaeyamensis TaxID=367791 RepID=UPI0008062658|nr:DUF5683 domain-containing protein [Flammeovirga yaeyamensis]ANQ47486.1 hypothetical protein MY04_0103 [Flammeovirga sp. MY04]NMF34125.1 hypothetical protein [Flammeovirga yaeyamensis]